MAQETTQNFNPSFQPLLDALIEGTRATYNWPQQYYDSSKRYAPFSPDQQAAFDAIRRSATSPAYSQGMDQARSLTMGAINRPMPMAAADPTFYRVATPQWSPEALSRYENPYTRSVVDATLADIDRATQVARARTTAKQAGMLSGAGAGSSLGPGADLVLNDLEEKALRAKASASANLRNQGFQTAGQMYGQDMQRGLQAAASNQAAYGQRAQRGLQAATANHAAGLQGRALRLQGARDIAGMATAQQGMGLQNANAMLQSGALQQAGAQRPLDFDYSEWLRQQSYGRDKQNWLAGILYGSPKTQTTSGTASPWATAAGLGLTGLGALGGTGAFGTTLANGTRSPGWLSDLGGFLKNSSWMPQNWTDGGRIGYARGGAFDDLDDGDDDDADVVSTFDNPDMIPLAFGEPEGGGGLLMGSGGEDVLPGGADALAAQLSRPSLAERIPSSGFDTARIDQLMEETKQRPVGSAGLWTDPSGQPTVDNFLTRLGLGMLMHNDKPLTSALGAAGSSAVQGLASARKEAIAHEALRQRGAGERLQATGKLLAEQNRLKAQAILKEADLAAPKAVGDTLLSPNGTVIKDLRQPKFVNMREGDQDVTYQVAPDGTRTKVASGSAFAPERNRYQERELPTAGDNIQKEVSFDGGKSWLPIGTAYDRRDPVIVTQQFNPATNSMDIIAVPRSAVMAAVRPPQAPAAATAASGSPPDAQPAPSAAEAAPPAEPRSGTVATPQPGETSPGVGGVVIGGGGAARPDAVETASRKALVSEAWAPLNDLQRMIVSPGGKGVNRQLLAEIWARVPGTEGARLHNQMRVIVGNRLRIETGAAVKDSEIDDNLSKYMPRPWDNDAMASQKLTNMRQFYSTMGGSMRMKLDGGGDRPDPLGIR